MKKLIVLVLAVMLACALLPVRAESLAGGWNIPESNAVTEEAAAALNKAVSKLVGCGYEAVALLGTQVVAGVNYCLLCRVTVVYPGAVPGYALVYVWQQPDGSAEILGVVPFDIADELTALRAAEDEPALTEGIYDDIVSERAYAMVNTPEEGIYAIEIHWSDSADTEYVWTMSARQEEGLLLYNDCVKTKVVTGENGEQTEYTANLIPDGYFTLLGEDSFDWSGAAEENCKTCVFVLFPQ